MSIDPAHRQAPEMGGELAPEVLHEIRYGTSDPRGGVMPEPRDEFAGKTPLDDKHLLAQLDAARHADKTGVLDEITELGDA